MTSRKTRRAHSCARTTEPDWLDHDEQRTTGHNKAEIKTIQLARQVEEALSCALASSASACLRDILVIAVTPAAGSALLRVAIALEGEKDEGDYEEVRGALLRARGYLRAEVARAIHRKRVPSLEFEFAPTRRVDWDAYDES